MTVTTTFDGVTLQKPSLESMIEYPANFGKVQLESGGVGLQGSTTVGFECTWKCYTTTHSNITDLINKVGTVGDLVVGSTTYSNVMIQPPIKEMPVFPAAEAWFYYVSFVQGIIASAGTVVINGGTP
jgi:hypothetical protein